MQRTTPTHTMARLLVFVETGFHYVLLVSLALPAHGFQLSCNQINCLLFYFLFHLFFTVCTVLHGGHRTTCRISCFLPRCGPRTVEEFVWFSCVVSPRLGYLSKPCWSTAANHNKCYFQDILKTNVMSFKKLSPHSGKALPCVNLRGQLAVCTALKGKLAF